MDDCRDTADSQATLLALWGLDSCSVYEGEVALDLAPIYQPDVALLDLGMPEMDGYRLAEHFRMTPELRGMPLVAVTGYGDETHRRLCEKAGFVLHLTKPPNLDVLRDFLTLLAREKGTQQSADMGG